MMRLPAGALMILLLWGGAALAADPPPATAEPTPEDLAIIAEMETLQMLELVEAMEVVIDFDVLDKEEHHDKTE